MQITYEQSTFHWGCMTKIGLYIQIINFHPIICRSGLVVKFVLAMHEPRVRFTAATFVLSFCTVGQLLLRTGSTIVLFL
jgi:hypothetical protein